MRLLIFEDEPLALERIQSIIQASLPHWQMVGTAQSIKEASSLLASGISYDMLLCDIQLADGLSFKIFNDLQIEVPVIFITAYDQYALESFEYNCIDYILKPIQEDRLLKAFSKHEKLIQSNQSQTLPKEIINQLHNYYQPKLHKKRFLAKVGSKIIFKPVEEIAYFFTEDKIVYMKEVGSSRKFMINHSLEELETVLLDPNMFYRINRSVIINLESLIEMKAYHNGRLKLSLNALNDTEIVVARERVSEFKNWINQ
jgi:DNA-binding LytR/AlgR family response regulator